MSKKKTILLIYCLVTLIILLLPAPMGIVSVVYNDNFGHRYHTEPHLILKIEDFPGLQSKDYQFPSNHGQVLAAKVYSRPAQAIKGLIVLAHGFGGGHIAYLDIANYFTEHGFIVFAYDATGNDASEGSSVIGVPQGVIDLDYALSYVATQADFAGLPILLWGHSWGAYSAGSVLALHPEVKAAVLVSGPNSSLNMLDLKGRELLGFSWNILRPYIGLYEKMRFGSYASSAMERGFAHATTQILLAHSRDDATIAYDDNFATLQGLYQSNPRFHFISFEDRGHSFLFYQDDVRAYVKTVDEAADAWADSQSPYPSDAEVLVWYSAHWQRDKASALDEDFMAAMLHLYENSLD